jgi:hypothetical protein
MTRRIGYLAGLPSGTRDSEQASRHSPAIAFCHMPLMQLILWRRQPKVARAKSSVWGLSEG